MQAVLDSAFSTASNTIPVNILPQRSRLLRLPPELLNYIVTLAVVKKRLGCRTVVSNVKKQQVHDRVGILAVPASPGLACTSVFLRALVLPIYYGQNTFWFISPAQAVDWLSLKLRRKDEAIVRHIIVCLKGGARVDISLKDNTNELVVEFDNLDKYLGVNDQNPRPETGVSSWVEEINNGSLYARKPSDKIADLCLYLSLYDKDRKWLGCNLTCVDEGFRMW